MGFFAFLSDPNDTDVDYQILRCHVNFWCLSGLFRHTFFWDVGLDIQTGEKAFSRFQLAIPSRTTSDFRDLINQVQDHAVAQMIFGKPVTISASVLELDGEKLSLVRIGSAILDEQRSGPSFSLWSLQTASQVPAGSRIYLRIRFQVSRVGRCWQWKRFLVSQYGALVDVRFADVREAWNVIGGDALQSRIVPIAKLFFFVVAPARFHLVATSPPAHYIRILEARSWEVYLERKATILGRDKLSIYQWRNDSSNPITTSDPFRVFMDIHQELGVASPTNILLAVLGALAIVAVGVRLTPDLPHTVADGLASLCTLVRAHAVGTSLAGAVTVAYFILNLSDEFIRRSKRVGRAFDWMERALFRAPKW
jgi:hypothetical protein